MWLCRSFRCVGWLWCMKFRVLFFKFFLLLSSKVHLAQALYDVVYFFLHGWKTLLTIANLYACLCATAKKNRKILRLIYFLFLLRSPWWPHTSEAEWWRRFTTFYIHFHIYKCVCNEKLLIKYTFIPSALFRIN